MWFFFDVVVVVVCLFFFVLYSSVYVHKYIFYLFLSFLVVGNRAVRFVHIRIVLHQRGRRRHCDFESISIRFCCLLAVLLHCSMAMMIAGRTGACSAYKWR